MENNTNPNFTPKGPSQFEYIVSWYKANSKTIRGIGALIVGTFALYYTRHTIINFFIFLVGVLFIYYGLSLLGITTVTNIVDKLVGKIKD